LINFSKSKSSSFGLTAGVASTGAGAALDLGHATTAPTDAKVAIAS